jgi:hypothetical protein
VEASSFSNESISGTNDITFRESRLFLRLSIDGILLVVEEVMGVELPSAASPDAQGMMGSAFGGSKEPLEELARLEDALRRTELPLLLYKDVFLLRMRGMLISGCCCLVAT